MSEKPTQQEIERYVQHLFSPNGKQEWLRIFGFMAGIASKQLLEAGGCEVNYRINGEDISNIRKLAAADLELRLELAIKDQRYEDAAVLRDIMQHKPRLT